jgi:hypothetical protein
MRTKGHIYDQEIAHSSIDVIMIEESFFKRFNDHNNGTLSPRKS